MRFKIKHHTNYHYSKPVLLGPQLLRFHPRDDGAQRILEHRLDIFPAPVGRNDHLDLEGNRVTQVWFDGETQQFDLDMSMEVETLRRNPFDFILSSQAQALPVDHEQDMICARAYLQRIDVDDSVTAFAAELSQAVNRDSVSFLNRLSELLYKDYTHLHRETGAPQTPAFTLQNRSGACRDLTVLFVDCCRAEGIAARFASGYQKGDLQSERRHLHAWPEVYLPGAGWRGFDPTHGEAVADAHITVAAAAHPRDTMPVSGSFIGEGASSRLDYELQIEVLQA